MFGTETTAEADTSTPDGSGSEVGGSGSEVGGSGSTDGSGSAGATAWRDTVIVPACATRPSAYSWDCGATANAWTSMGAQLANPAYRIVGVKTKQPRTYYRLKLHIGKIEGGDDTKMIEYLDKDTLWQYEIDIYKGCSEEIRKEKDWKHAQLKHLYQEAIVNHNVVTNQYKEGKNICFDAGFDLFYPAWSDVKPNTGKKLNHCIQCSMEKVKCGKDGNETIHQVGYYLYPRSSMGTKTPLSLSNSVGIIDSGYRGNIIAAVHCGRSRRVNGWDSVHGYTVSLFQRLVQICPPNLSYPMEIVLVDNEAELGASGTRGTGAFGSTGY